MKLTLKLKGRRFDQALFLDDFMQNNQWVVS